MWNHRKVSFVVKKLKIKNKNWWPICFPTNKYFTFFSLPFERPYNRKRIYDSTSDTLNVVFNNRASELNYANHRI